jgi:NitT/TauT family transport system ATP-binding protein
VSIVFQDYTNALLPWRTVAGNVRLGLEALRVPRALRAERIAELLSQVGLSAHADKYPGQLSGGMQQRLQIARCLAQQPDVLLMDEPFGALDAMTRQSLQDEVLRIVADRRITVVFVTHDLEEAIYLGDSVVAMSPNPGQIRSRFEVALPRPRDQLNTPEQPQYRALRRQLYDFIRAFR